MVLQRVDREGVADEVMQKWLENRSENNTNDNECNYWLNLMSEIYRTCVMIDEALGWQSDTGSQE